MRKASDTTLRSLALLQLIPAYPQTKSTAKIHRELRDKNADFNVDIRSTQRDLERLSASFPLSCKRQGRANHWFWLDKAAFAQIPAMSKSTALAFKLAAEHLKPLVPPSTLRLLAPYFKHATEVLRHTKLGRWSTKVRAINRGPELIAPVINPKVRDVVYEALLEDKQFEVDYQSKGQTESKRRTLNPLGIVSRSGLIYLIATSWDYKDPRHYALHRMSRASPLVSRANRITNFNLAHYIEEEKGFSYPMSDEKIKLRALFSDDAATHLTEAKLSDDQKITNKDDGRMLVEASVANTAELRWWLLGFGNLVEVLGPASLRKEFTKLTKDMKSLYDGNRKP